MRLSLVSLSILFVAVACSDATNPLAATRRGISKQTVGDTIPPLAQGARLDTLPLPTSQYFLGGLNNLGQLSGIFTPPTGANEAFRGSLGHFQFLDSTGAGPLNDEGDAVIGLAGNISGIWTKSGQIVPLQAVFPDSFPQCAAEGINDLRQTAGLCVVETPNGLNSDVVEWSPAGKPQILSANGVVLSNGEAFSINQLGQVAGFDFDLSPSQAFVITPNQKARILPSLNGSQSAEARRVNERQWVAGQAASSQCGNRAVAWTPTDSAVDLGICGQSFWINDGNIVVGEAQQNNPADDFAFVWTPTIGLRRLPSVQNSAGNIEFDQPIVINEQNQIIGTARVMDSNFNPIASFNVMWTLPIGYGGSR